MAYSKQSIKKVKELIKTLVVEQKQLRLQRKTVHFTGTRTLAPWQATAKHLINRYELRHFYIAYAIMRDKTIDDVEPKRKTEFNQLKVDKILETYGEVICDNPEGHAGTVPVSTVGS